MSNPPNPYNRSYNFEDFQSLNPNSPLPAQHLENELNNIEQTLDATVSRLSEIQNADGSLKLTANVEQILLNAATVEATNVANQVSADYLAANFDSNAAASASSSASAAAQSALLAEASKVQANTYSIASQQSAVTANMNAVSAISSKNAAENYADNANASKIAAYGYKLSAQNAQIGASSVYQSALQLKENLDSNYGQLLYKREDVNHVSANMLFNGGDINNTLIGKIFPGTSFDLNSKLVNEGPINATGLNYINGPWWVEGNSQAENPSDIVTRDMMNCLVQTWKTFGPNVARGELKPLQTGVNGTPNPAWSQTDYPNEKFIEPIVYNGEEFNTNQLDPVKVQNSALTPKGYVDKKLGNKLDYINHEVSFKNGLDNINWKINNIETLSINYDSINLWRYPNQYFRTEIVGGGIQLSSTINGTSVLLNNESIEFTNSTNQKTKLSTENNLLKISTGIKFADGSTLTTAGVNCLPITGGIVTGPTTFGDTITLNTVNGNILFDNPDSIGISGTQLVLNKNGSEIYLTGEKITFGSKGSIDSISNYNGLRLNTALFVDLIPDRTIADGPYSEVWDSGFGTEDTDTGYSSWFNTEGFYSSGNGKSFNLSPVNGIEITNVSTNITNSSFTVQNTFGTQNEAGFKTNLLTINENGFNYNSESFDGNDGWISILNFNSVNGLTINGSKVAVDSDLISINSSLNLKANIASPTFTGTPQAPTPPLTDLSARIATTSYVKNQNYVTTSASNTGKITITNGPTAAPLNIGTGVIPSGPVNGDIWIAADSFNYKNSSGITRTVATLGNNNPFTNYQSITVSNNANPALKITQLGTGEALRVEDEASPDATAFVVSNNGRVGIGVAPDATVALTVDSTGIKVNGATLIPAAAVSNPPVTSGNMSHSEYLKELIITINGVNYAIPLRVV